MLAKTQKLISPAPVDKSVPPHSPSVSFIFRQLPNGFFNIFIEKVRIEFFPQAVVKGVLSFGT
jgi:hypothetical protein